MLVRFSVENYKSFKEETIFDMNASEVKQHPKFVTKTKTSGEVLNFAAIYGANASGKSNFVSALSFVSQAIKIGLSHLSTLNTSFKITEKVNNLSVFKFHYIINEKYLVYHLSVDNLLKTFSSEELFLFDNELNEYVEVFSRKGNAVVINESLYEENELVRLNIYTDDFLNNVDSSRKTFLQEMRSKNYACSNKIIKTAYTWFFVRLFIITDDNFISREFALTQTTSEGSIDGTYLKRQSDLLKGFDTGVDDILSEEISKDRFISIESETFYDLFISQTQNEEEVDGVKKKTFKSVTTLNVYCVAIKGSEITISKMKYIHNETGFDFNEESTGTKKIIDYSSLFFIRGATVIIDEIDRSFHHNLTMNFISKFFDISDNCQLIVTTHDPLLMDLKNFRRDSFWFTNKDEFGVSRMYSLEEFKPRFDKIIYKDYLSGRYEAVPCLDGTEFDEQQ